ncbi:sensor domain-containing protein [Nocardiopsis sp. MG754419]|uniref:sensor domain-containing protein n=1 Tax=Nocardiopsis sp. MG754419 TaxID=2259865 RepID=UPI001BA626EB|nr:sensor domain-containing protein [Nocardiopsis sp. MG754419]MBR8743907.1 histidine kinase [Nocardiopsis sp. MG754419]
MRTLSFARVARDTRYLLLGLPLAAVAFGVVVTGLVVGVGTAPLFVGAFLLSGTLFAARVPAHLERLRLSGLYGRPVVRLPYRSAPPGSGILRRALTPLTCARSRMDALHALVGAPLALVVFVLALVWWTLAVGGLLYPLWGWSLHLVPGYTDLGTHLLPENPTMAAMVVAMIGGALFALTLPPVLRGLAGAHAALSRLLLLAPEEVTARVLTTRAAPTLSGTGAERRYVTSR